MSNFNQTSSFLADLKKTPQREIYLKFHEWVSGCSMWTDGRADMTKRTVGLRDFANALNKCTWYVLVSLNPFNRKCLYRAAPMLRHYKLQ
jgi:hypothetical protein